ncbi:unnamed protein product [Hymenolepis diminuta]|uniref:Uncharacterized protein n=1 Tax=Hymenolepis diminuta TaxID=6216 RepID=A0A564Y8F4_HYMDI|nr:unnamed protein product [Hymenolepis diminuta]
MLDNTKTNEMKRHSRIVSIKAKYNNLEIARFLQVTRSFLCKVRKELPNENNRDDEVDSTMKRKRGLINALLTHNT